MLHYWELQEQQWDGHKRWNKTLCLTFHFYLVRLVHFKNCNANFCHSFSLLLSESLPTSFWNSEDRKLTCKGRNIMKLKHITTTQPVVPKVNPEKVQDKVEHVKHRIQPGNSKSWFHSGCLLAFAVQRWLARICS